MRCSPLALLALALALACGGGRADDPAPARPNLLLLVGDDVGTELACYGTPGLQTPHLDALARSGVRFTRAYAPTGVCAPSRATFYTGLAPAEHGVMGFEPIDPFVPTFGELLGAAGYRTGLLGKLGARPKARFPFDWIERTDPGDQGARDVAFHEESFARFLDAGDDRPFALVVNFRDAHWPLPTDGAPAREGDQARPHDPAEVRVPPVLVDARGTRAELARYHDALQRLDATVGALLAMLEERGLDRSTLVLFTSDNGPPFPRAKTTVYEWGLRQAFLVRWPGVVRPGRVEERFVTLADVLPTALDLAGADPATWERMDGRSFVPLLRGAPPTRWREHVFGFHGSHRAGDEVPARSVRDGQWKYIWNPYPEREFHSLAMEVSAGWSELFEAADEGDAAARARLDALLYRPAEELYDLEADPWELVNLAGTPRGRAARAELRRVLGERLAATGDPLLELWKERGD